MDGKFWKDLIKPRTIFACMFYATFCYLIVNHVNPPKELTQIVFVILGFYFGQRTKKI